MFAKQAEIEARKIKRRQEKELRNSQKSAEQEKPQEIQEPEPKLKRQRLDSNVSAKNSIVSSGAKNEKKSVELPAKGRKLNLSPKA